jgi:hypothetical protein
VGVVIGIAVGTVDGDGSVMAFFAGGAGASTTLKGWKSSGVLAQAPMKSSRHSGALFNIHP